MERGAAFDKLIQRNPGCVKFVDDFQPITNGRNSERGATFPIIGLECQRSIDPAGSRGFHKGTNARASGDEQVNNFNRAKFNCVLERRPIVDRVTGGLKVRSSLNQSSCNGNLVVTRSRDERGFLIGRITLYGSTGVEQHPRHLRGVPMRGEAIEPCLRQIRNGLARADSVWRTPGLPLPSNR